MRDSLQLEYVSVPLNVAVYNIPTNWLDKLIILRRRSITCTCSVEDIYQASSGEAVESILTEEDVFYRKEPDFLYLSLS